MSVAADILESWRHPRRVMRRLLDRPQREDKALAFLMAACFLMFVAQWPGLARAAHLAPEIPLNARLGGSLLALLFLAPLAFYLIAALSHVVARLLGGQGDYYGARLALFWALLVVSPATLFLGLLSGFAGDAPSVTVTGAAVLAAFLTIWLASLWESEHPAPDNIRITGAGHVG